MIEKLTALGESEMQMFRFMLDRPAGAILTVETDIMLAKLLAADGLLDLSADNKAVVPEGIRKLYQSSWDEEAETRWEKRNWMYKCLEAGQFLYGVMTWEVLRRLFTLRFADAGSNEVRELFETTPPAYQWFSERDGKLVLNGFEKDDYYKRLIQIQGDVPFYIPTEDEVRELYDQGCLISREAHTKLKDFIAETFGCDEISAILRVGRLYEAVNSRVRVNDAVEAFCADDGEGGFAFASDEDEVKFIELYMEMSRECRIRDNRGHDYYEMVAIMAKENLEAPMKKAKGTAAVKRVKIGRNEPCPCGSGKKYKNCCGRSGYEKP